MKHLAAYALLVLGGKEKPSADDVEKLLKEAGCTADKEKVKALIEKVGAKSFHEQAAAGLTKMASMGGGAPAAGGTAAAAGAAPAKEEEKPKEEEAEDVDMGGLFGDDDDDY
jgi:large subunit ribosomal protein LP2